MPNIVLSTLNARYAHASLGLRYLLANLGELQPEAVLREFVIGQKTEDLAEAILAESPRIVGFGVYIWNVEETRRLVAQLRVLRPDLLIVLGGPEVSHETDQQPICALADHVITGWGDVSFAELCRQLLAGERPAQKVIPGRQPPLDELALPYRLYGDEDIARRYLYVEASRGCPFKCEFCLSALDRTAWPFALDRFMAELETLYQRGARQFKFVDRTFNLKVDTSLAILQFFLDKLEAAPDDPVFAHFELVPDHLPERLKAMIVRFPPGSLQFEIGIQSFDPEVQARISRRQKNDAAEANLRWLREHTSAHLHVDLIAGLPGESVDQFARGFDKLVALGPQEIQFGILKRLRGAPIARHTKAFGLRFSPDPPYNVLATDAIDFATFQRLTRFARYWDLVANSGRYGRTLPLLLGDAPFANFLAFSDWLFEATSKTHAFAQERLVHLIHEHLASRGIDAGPALSADYHGGGGRARLAFDPEDLALPTPKRRRDGALPKRQARHLAAGA
ncbi:B12-binding domain-containing radical SAM protein [Pseudomarimonas salicorniae]|uniref:B12-binding domain-containing radical SAM protein n=1 Tax=Pseudomarimonas salicorniae TaxID=2933270 RepID=A0ABT0GKG2_9GAMM|nr:radical SAM protein [Lysobacter sp. CAU 1642]MCK7594857.1 B12-binding domain-containing radical SAM protein [Lysobacter sp. CAU 1642]